MTWSKARPLPSLPRTAAARWPSSSTTTSRRLRDDHLGLRSEDPAKPLSPPRRSRTSLRT